MKKYIFAVLLLMVFAAGCSQIQTQESSDQSKEPAQMPEKSVVQQKNDIATQPKEIEVKSRNEGVLSQDIKDAIDDQLLPGVKGVIPVNYAKVDYGDKYVFGIGLQNLLNKPDQYKINIEFFEARDRINNIISTDDQIMNTWLKTNLDEEFEIPSGGKETISILFEVGDIMQGVKPSPGSYYFDVEILHARGDRYITDEYIGTKKFTLKVS